MKFLGVLLDDNLSWKEHEYANLVWGSKTKWKLETGKTMQPTIRIVHNKIKLEHTKELFKSANILNLHTKTSPPVFTSSFQMISHLYYTRSSTLNFSKPKLNLTKTKSRISVRSPAIWNDFVKDCLKSIEKTPFSKLKMKSKLLNFDNEISCF